MNECIVKSVITEACREIQVYAGPLYAMPIYAGPFYAGPIYAGPFYAGPFYAGPIYAGPTWIIHPGYRYIAEERYLSEMTDCLHRCFFT